MLSDLIHLLCRRIVFAAIGLYFLFVAFWDVWYVVEELQTVLEFDPAWSNFRVLAERLADAVWYALWGFALLVVANFADPIRYKLSSWLRY